MWFWCERFLGFFFFFFDVFYNKQTVLTFVVCIQEQWVVYSVLAWLWQHFNQLAVKGWEEVVYFEDFQMEYMQTIKDTCILVYRLRVQASGVQILSLFVWPWAE